MTRQILFIIGLTLAIGWLRPAVGGDSMRIEIIKGQIDNAEEAKKQAADLGKSLKPEWNEKRKALDAASKALAQATERRNAAGAAVGAVQLRLRNELRQTGDYAATQKQLDAAEAQLEARRAAVLEPHRETKPFKDARRRTADAREAVEKLKSRRAYTPQQMLDASKAVLEAERALLDLEEQTLAQDDDYRSLKNKLGDLERRLAELSAELELKIQSHDDYTAATAKLDKAKQARDKAADAHAQARVPFNEIDRKLRAAAAQYKVADGKLRALQAQLRRAQSN